MAAALTQPLVPVPVTEYEVLVVGVTTAVPDEYVYVLAPVGEMVNDAPPQTAPLFTVTVGAAATLTVLKAPAEETQPKELVPVTV